MKKILFAPLCSDIQKMTGITFNPIFFSPDAAVKVEGFIYPFNYCNTDPHDPTPDSEREKDLIEYVYETGDTDLIVITLEENYSNLKNALIAELTPGMYEIEYIYKPTDMHTLFENIYVAARIEGGSYVIMTVSKYIELLVQNNQLYVELLVKIESGVLN
jgi:hypothetical protein